MFAERTNWNLEPNRLGTALAAHRAAGKPLLDLTVSNPTECGFAYDRENPQPVHEVPVVRSDLRGCRKRNTCFVKFAQKNKKQRGDAAEKMHGVGSSKNVKETAGLIASNVHALRYQLAPRQQLSRNKKKSQNRCEQP